MKTRVGPFATLTAMISLASWGCAAMQDSVVAKVSDNRAEVSTRSNEVTVGDRVDIIRRVCREVNTSDAVERCGTATVGSGEIVRVLDDRHSVARFPSGTDFNKGDVVEKRERAR